MGLPTNGGPDDVVAVVRVLRSKATGTTAAELRATLDSSIVDARKLAALDFWGVTKRDGDRILLTDLGRQLAKDNAELPTVLRAVLNSVKAYRMALEWAHHAGAATLVSDDLGTYWHQHFSADLDTTSEKSISQMCNVFLRLADSAGLGTFVLGRKGAATRIEFDRDALAVLVEEGPATPPWTPTATAESPVADLSEFDRQPVEESLETPAGEQLSTSHQETPEPERAKPLRVFITHGKNHELLDQVKTMLDMYNIPYEVAIEEESTAIPVPEKVLAAMRRCSAGVMIVSVDEGAAEGAAKINDNVLIEVGAAFVLYDRRVVLVWDRRLAVPSNLQGLYRCEFEGEQMDWPSGVKLMKALREFRDGGDAI